MSNTNSSEDIKSFSLGSDSDTANATRQNQIQNITPNPTSNSAKQNKKYDVAYHIMLDSDFGDVDIETQYIDCNYIPHIQGRIRRSIDNEQTNKIPLVFSLDDVIHIITKQGGLIDTVNKKGCTKNKQAIINGVIILELDVSSAKQVPVSVTEIDGIVNGNRNYGKLENTQDLSVYEVNGKYRGIIDNSMLHNCKILSAKYVLDKNLSKELVNFGFKLMLSFKSFTAKHIRLLKKLSTLENNTMPSSEWYKYDMSLSEEERKLMKSEVKSNSMASMVHPASMQISHSGGFTKNVNYEELYKKEKKKYLTLQKIAIERGLVKKSKH